jgi:hypothetical protein
MRGEFKAVNNEHAGQTYADQKRRWYATRVWHCSDGELTCVRVCMPYESSEGPEPLSRDV